ncbi:MAG: hypothetical protein U9R20_07470 [Thermodesulfobacteriota bacterium]|nr:hypothetical protein [Thermodesulfobacteriota bacterium]
MGNKLISMILVACLVLLPVQVYAYGGDGDGDGDQFTDIGDIGVGGPPLTFTPPDNSDYDIPESYTNPENTVAGDSEQLTYESPSAELSTVVSKWLEKELEEVGKGAVIAGKVAIITISVIGAGAAIIAMAPATAASAGTVAALGLVAKLCGGTALVLTATMKGAQSYGKGIDKGKSQDEAASEGLKDGMIKAVKEFVMNLTTATGVISTLGEIQEVVGE